MIITSNIVSNILKGNIIGDSSYIKKGEAPILDALLLEDGGPLYLEDGRFLQLEEETIINKSKVE